MTDYAAIIKDIRGKLRLSQRVFAQELEVVKSTVQMWEMGRKKPSPLSLRNIARLMQKEGLEAGLLPADAAIAATPTPSLAPKAIEVLPHSEVPIGENLGAFRLPAELPSGAGANELQLRREQLRAVKERARRKRLQREGK